MTTEFVKITDVNSRQDAETLQRAGEILRSGGLVVFPTETVYGLGGDGTNAESACAIYAAKGRPADNPLIIHIAFPEDAEKYTETSDLYFRLAERFMPGPLTVIMTAKSVIPLEVRAGLDTVAVRCPSHSVAHALICAAGVPIAAPSANLSGKPSPTCAAHVKDDMDGRVDMIIDGGDSDVGLESTIVKIEGNGSLTLLRPGAVTLDDLLTVTDRVKVADAVTGQLAPGEKVLSPGMKYKHYAPDAPFYLLDGTEEEIFSFLKTKKGRIAVLTYEEDLDAWRDDLPDKDFYAFGRRNDRVEQAHLLFHLLREIDKRGYTAIYAPLPGKDGIGLALYNRMIRAAAHQIIKL